MLSQLFCGVLLVPLDTLAYRGTFQTRQIDRRLIPSLNRRNAIVSAGNETIGNIGNVQYVANITVGGSPFIVILGTCSLLFSVAYFIGPLLIYCLFGDTGR